MPRILITGGAGGLGRKVIQALQGTDNTVRVMSRRPRPTNHDQAIEWAQADLANGDGLQAAVADSDTIIHAATHAPLSSGNLRDMIKHPQEVDVQGTGRLLEHARANRVKHIIYVSIVGTELVPMSYYDSKLKAEALVREGQLPWSILRATQFHSLIDQMLRLLRKLPIMLVPAGYLFQTVDTREVAARLRTCVVDGPGGQLPDYGGPAIQTLGDMARTWLRIQGQQRFLIELPLLGKTARALRSGALTCPQHRDGTISWENWLEETYRRHEVPTAMP